MLEKALRKVREDFRYSQDTVAQHLNIPRPSYTQIENGKRRITGEEIVALLELYGLSFEELTGSSRRPNREKQIDKTLKALWALTSMEESYFYRFGAEVLIELINGKPKTKKK